MSANAWIALGALWSGLAVGSGAFGAHYLRAGAEAGEGFTIWDTAARFQLAHGIALVLYGLFRARAAGGSSAGWCLFLGSLCFSGSLYGLALGGPKLLGPITPLGGALMIAGWALFARAAWRARG